MGWASCPSWTQGGQDAQRQVLQRGEPPQQTSAPPQENFEDLFICKFFVRQARCLSYGTGFYNLGKISGNNEPGTFDKAKFCPWIPNSLWNARIALIIYASVV